MVRCHARVLCGASALRALFGARTSYLAEKLSNFLMAYLADLDAPRR